MAGSEIDRMARAASPRVPGTRVTPLLLAAILAVVAAVYAASLGGELVYDDLLLVARNPGIGDPGNLLALFGQGYWDFLGPAEAAHIGYWRPLTACAHAFSFWLGRGETWAFHATSLAVHLGATAAAWSLARQLSKSVVVAAIAALVFGLHPVHVESVAWISALNDPLFGLFALVSVDLFLRWRERGSHGVPLLAALAFAIALLAKELAAAVLPLVALLDWTHSRRLGESASRKAPERAYGTFAFVLALYYLARALVFASPWAGFDRITTDFGVSTVRLGLLRVEILGGSLRLLAWPVHLNLFRPFRPHVEPSDPAILLAVAALLVFVVLTVLAWRRRSWNAFAALLFVPLALSPALVRVESLGAFPLSERFLYLPVFGFALALGLAARRFLSAGPALAATAVLGLLYSARDLARIPFWHDEETLFRQAAEDSPRSPYVLWGLGRVLLGKVQDTHDPGVWAEALATYERAQLLLVESRAPDTDLMVSSRDYLQVQLGIGYCYLFEDEREGWAGYESSIRFFQQLAEQVAGIRDRTREARSLGINVRDENLELEQVQTALGVAYLKAGDLDAARRHLQDALVINPNSPEARHDLGLVFAGRGEYRVALDCFERALALRPKSVKDRLLIARTAQALGEDALAERMAQELLAEAAAGVEPLIVLAAIRLAGNDPGGALTFLTRALERDGNHGYAWYHRGKALLLQGAEREGLDCLRRAVALMPRNFEAHYDLGVMLGHRGDFEQAVPLLVRAYALCPTTQLVAALRMAFSKVPVLTTQQIFELATIDRGRRQFEQAEAWIEMGLNAIPDDAELLFLRGRILADQQRFDEAIETMRQAVPRLEHSFVAHDELGSLLARTGRFEEALRFLELARGIGPPGEWAGELRERALQALLSRIESCKAEVLETGPAPGRDPPTPTQGSPKEDSRSR